jgi:hypothetical protein
MKMCCIGFTGTKRGMTTKQWARVDSILRQFVQRGRVTAHLGDHIGADCDFAGLCRTMGRDKIMLVSHPPKDSHSRAFYQSDVERPAAGFAERTRDLVGESDLLIACPKEAQGEGRGGTWGVVRYARRRGKRVIVVRPDGVATMEIARTDASLYRLKSLS